MDAGSTAKPCQVDRIRVQIHGEIYHIQSKNQFGFLLQIRNGWKNPLCAWGLSLFSPRVTAKATLLGVKRP